MDWFDDHVSETSDAFGTAANVVQGADVGGIRNMNPAFMPGTEAWGTIDDHDVVSTVVGTESKALGNAFNGVGAITGAIGAIAGGNAALAPDATFMERVIGGGNFATGLIGTIGSMAGMGTTSSGLLTGLSQAGGAAGLGADVLGGAAWGAGAASGGALAGTALATGASVVGAGLAGYGLGQYGDAAFKGLGFAHDAAGENQGISDVSADLALRFGNFVGGGENGSETTSGNIAGSAASLLLAVPGGAAALGSAMIAPYAAIYNAVGHHAD